MEKNILCTSCIYWVKCKKAERKEKFTKPYGFCTLEDLFTYTAKTRCQDCENGEPMSEAQWEEAQRAFD